MAGPVSGGVRYSFVWGLSAAIPPFHGVLGLAGLGAAVAGATSRLRFLASSASCFWWESTSERYWQEPKAAEETSLTVSCP